MELPKKVIIAGLEVVVRTNSKEAGGSYDYKKNKPVIVIGTRDPEDVLSIFLHECFEAICYERMHRYREDYAGTKDGMLFILTHKEFDNAIRDLALAVKDIIKR